MSESRSINVIGAICPYCNAPLYMWRGKRRLTCFGVSAHTFEIPDDAKREIDKTPIVENVYSHIRSIDLSQHTIIFGESSSDKSTKFAEVCKNLALFLEHKDTKYGNSVQCPLHIFSKQNSEDLLYARIDDKISRIKNSDELRKNDVVDLMGYLVHVCIKEGWMDFKDLLD